MGLDSVLYIGGIVLAGEFISIKDKIIATAIDIISESGMSKLTSKNLAMKGNMTEALLYKFYGDINEVLVDVVDYYAKFDKSIQKTVSSKSITYLDKVDKYIEAYATYYDNYYALSTLMLQYEELLHNSYTRDKIADCIQDRRNFVRSLFEGAISEGEITCDMGADDLTNQLTGMVMVLTLDRRINYHKDTFKEEFRRYMSKWLACISKR